MHCLPRLEMQSSKNIYSAIVATYNISKLIFWLEQASDPLNIFIKSTVSKSNKNNNSNNKNLHDNTRPHKSKIPPPSFRITVHECLQQKTEYRQH